MEKIIYDVLDTIEKAGFEAYIVGGYVRDFLMKKKSLDIDICTNARPKDLMLLFASYQAMALECGNVSVQSKNYKFEITTYRKEIKYIDNRKPEEIEYIDKLSEDIKRRDFTVNTICMNKEGKITDLLSGKADIKKKIIRSLGDPNLKLEEDSLRIMRAIRFATVLKFKLDPKLKEAIKNNKDLLKNLSYERKKEELTKVFASENKKYGVGLLKELNLLTSLDLVNIEYVLRTNDLIGMWSLITKEDTYPFSKHEKPLIKEIKDLMDLDLSDPFVLYKYGIYSSSIAADLKKQNKKKIIKKYNNLQVKDKNEIKIKAEDICQILNKEPGKFLKDIFEDLEKQIIIRKLKNEEKALKDYIISKYDML